MFITFRSLVLLVGSVPLFSCLWVKPCGGEVLLLNEQKVVQLALEQNFSLSIEQLQTEVAQEIVALEKGAFDPEVQLRYDQSTDNNPQAVDPFNPNVPGVATIETEYLNGAVSGELQSGTAYSLGVDSVNQRGTFNQFEDEFISFAGIRVRQPLMRGLGYQVNQAEIRIAQRGFEISQWEFKQIVIDVISEVIVAYNDYCLALHNLNVARQLRDQARQLLDETSKRVEIGTLASLETVVAEAELAQREEAVLIARLTRISRGNLLKQLISNQPLEGVSLEIGDTPLVAVDGQYLHSDLNLDQALAQRPDYQQALLDIDRQETRILRDRNLKLPNLDLVGSYGLRGKDSSMGSSFDQVLSERSESYSLGLQFRYAIPNRSARSRYAISILNRNAAELELSQLKQRIALDLDEALKRMGINKERIEISRRAEILFQKSLQAELKKLEVGNSSNFVVLRLQSDLARAETRVMQAVTDYNKSVAEYNRITGNTLAKYNTLLP